MNILTDILSLIKRGVYAEKAGVNDVLVLEIDNYQFFVIYLVWTGTSILGTISDNYKTQSILVVFTFLYVLILNISTFVMESPMSH